MLNIITQADFDSLLKKEQAILFRFFDSKRALISLRVVEEWERECRVLGKPVNFYRLDADKHAFSQEWLAEQSREDGNVERGFGSISWLRHGRRIGFVDYAAKEGMETLAHLTNQYFDLGGPVFDTSHLSTSSAAQYFMRSAAF